MTSLDKENITFSCSERMQLSCSPRNIKSSFRQDISKEKNPKTDEIYERKSHDICMYCMYHHNIVSFIITIVIWESPDRPDRGLVVRGRASMSSGDNDTGSNLPTSDEAT